MASIQYGIRKPGSDFDRRPPVGDAPITKGKKMGGGSNGNSVKQARKQGIGRGQ